MRNLLKKNQIIVYVIALMLVTAGYLNFTSLNENEAQETASEVNDTNQLEENTQVADIGDATLVNSNDVVEETNNANNTNSIVDNSVNGMNNNTTNAQNNTNVQQTFSNVNSSDDYFAKSKLERETMYSQMLETYDKVLNSSNSLETQKQSATEEITKINETKNSIMVCENLIRTKGFENNVIFVNGESISVIIGAEELKQEEIAQIQNIISRELKAEIQNIHISTK